MRYTQRLSEVAALVQVCLLTFLHTITTSSETANSIAVTASRLDGKRGHEIMEFYESALQP